MSPMPDDLVFIKNSKHVDIAKYRARKFLKDECSICKSEAKWLGKPLVLRIDHVNGDKKDCRKENLRKVCPNCDSQLPTFCGRNNKNWKNQHGSGERKAGLAERQTR